MRSAQEAREYIQKEIGALSKTENWLDVVLGPRGTKEEGGYWQTLDKMEGRDGWSFSELLAAGVGGKKYVNFDKQLGYIRIQAYLDDKGILAGDELGRVQPSTGFGRGKGGEKAVILEMEVDLENIGT